MVLVAHEIDKQEMIKDMVLSPETSHTFINSLIERLI
jgi:hypothetical protein